MKLTLGQADIRAAIAHTLKEKGLPSVMVTLDIDEEMGITAEVILEDSLEDYSPNQISPTPNYAYGQAWNDLRNEIIDQLLTTPDGLVAAEDIKNAMDKVIVAYEIGENK